MNSPYAAIFAGLLVGIVGIGAHQTFAAYVRALDQATAQQCANSDWPKEAHDLHRDWCRDNGYWVQPQ